MTQALKFGTQTGSLVNHIMSGNRSPEPEIGMGVTILSWTDRNPGTVVQMFKIGKTDFIAVQADDYKRIDSNGMSELQDYEFICNEDNPITTYKNHAKKGWVRVRHNPESGRWNMIGDGTGYSISLGRREKYHDFSF